MCGIFGALYWPNLSEQTAHTALECLAHRGPDAWGLTRIGEAPIFLGHRRLSIVELSPLGSQPMRSPSGRYTITFNGEIYNFKELRREFEQAGYAFAGGSDTEVMLVAFEAYGIEKALQKFDGMFAFGVWDEKLRSLTLARDRIGEKPLYYAWNNASGFAFSSELKPIRTLLGGEARTDGDAIKSLMTWGYVAAPLSILAGTYKLMPGCFLTLSEQAIQHRPPFSPWKDNAHLSPKSYWNATTAFTHAPKYDADFAAATSDLDELLTKVIGDEVVADVPVGAFLSGGIDSTMIVAIMQKIATRPTKTFSIGFHDAAFNEAHHASIVANHLKTEHTELYISDEVARSVVPRLPTLFDEPFADSSQIPTYLVSKLAREQVTVSLSGDGGDEIFGGYPRCLWANKAWQKMRKMPHLLRIPTGKVLSAIPETAADAVLSPLFAFLPKHLQMKSLGRKMNRLGELLTVGSQEELYRKLLMLWSDDDPIVLRVSQPKAPIELLNGILADDYLQWMMLADVVQYLPEDILAKVDRAAMSVSLESRAPFLHHKVIEFAAKLPTEFKVGSLGTKRVLKELLYQYVPRSLIERPKMGFAVPLQRWLSGPLRGWAEHLLEASRLRDEGIFNAPLVRSRWDQTITFEKDLSGPIWSLLMFQAWKDEYKVAAPSNLGD